MSKLDIVTYTVLFVLYCCIAWLVALSLVNNGTTYQFNDKSDYTGLECVICNSTESLQPAKQMQVTQSSAMLHELSVNVELLPIDMLRSGQQGLRVQ